MFKQVKHSSLTLSLFVVNILIPVIALAPPSVPAPNNGSNPSGGGLPGSIDDSIWLLAISAVFLVFYFAKQFKMETR